MDKLKRPTPDNTPAIVLWLLPIIWVLVFLLCLSGCTVSHHLKQAKRHLKKAEMKGAVIAPDTVYKDRPIYIHAQDTSVKTDPVLDSVQFEKVINRYDSLVRKTATLIHPEELISAQQEIKRLKGRLIKGFSKDSTYYVPVDSVTELTIVLKDGLLDSVGIDRKPTTVTATVPVAVNYQIESGPGMQWWKFIIAAFIGLAVGVLMMVFKK